MDKSFSDNIHNLTMAQLVGNLLTETKILYEPRDAGNALVAQHSIMDCYGRLVNFYNGCRDPDSDLEFNNVTMEFHGIRSGEDHAQLCEILIDRMTTPDEFYHMHLADPRYALMDLTLVEGIGALLKKSKRDGVPTDSIVLHNIVTAGGTLREGLRHLVRGSPSPDNLIQHKANTVDLLLRIGEEAHAMRLTGKDLVEAITYRTSTAICGNRPSN